MSSTSSIRSLLQGRQPSDEPKQPKRLVEIAEADRIADDLVAKLENPASRAFYCSCAYYLTEAERQRFLEAARRARSPARYFTACAMQLLIKKGVYAKPIHISEVPF